MDNTGGSREDNWDNNASKWQQKKVKHAVEKRKLTEDLTEIPNTLREQKGWILVDWQFNTELCKHD